MDDWRNVVGAQSFLWCVGVAIMGSNTAAKSTLKREDEGHSAQLVNATSKLQGVAL